MDIALVNMPWQSLDYPSLALGILSEVARQGSCESKVSEYYYNITWAQYVLDQTSGQLTPKDYYDIADEGLYYGIGDWVFTPALYGVKEHCKSAYSEYLTSKGVDPAPAERMHAMAADFIEITAREIADSAPELVGFTSTFMQNIPSLALAKRLKELRPDIVTVMGGGNCEGVQGQAMHAAFAFLDYVVCGEGEISFAQLLEVLCGKRDTNDVAGLCWRNDAKISVANDPPKAAVPVGRIPKPDHSAYFQALERSSLRGWIEPKLVFESSRGCWWGEKHQCTFCGLNGALIQFRSKPQTDVLNHIAEDVARFKVLDVIMVDNIMDMSYFNSLLPALSSADWDLRIHYEVKSNLRADQIRALRSAGISQIQPGIESMSSRILALMDKGVTGTQNVQLLRDCEQEGMTVAWNYLYGFPGERPDDYWQVIQQLPALTHLQPPLAPVKLQVERFSPYFEQPALGFPHRWPASFYKMIYQVPDELLADLVYLFDAPEAGVPHDVIDVLATARL